MYQSRDITMMTSYPTRPTLITEATGSSR